MGGLAEYFRVDPTLLRVIYVVGSIVSAAFPGLLVYLLLWLLIPEDEDHAGPDAVIVDPGRVSPAAHPARDRSVHGLRFRETK